MKDLSALVIEQLVVGGTCNGAALELRQGEVVDGRTEGARREDIAFRSVDLVIGNFLCSPLFDCYVHILAV